MTHIEDNNPEIVATLPPLHPGEVQREEFIGPLGLTAGRLARACGVARSRIERIAAEEIGISGDTAVRLGRVFATEPELWMTSEHATRSRQKAAIGDGISALRPTGLGPDIDTC